MLGERLVAWILAWPARLLVAADSADAGPCDLIFLLMGNVETRAARAAELFHAGAAERIVFVRPGESEAVKAGLYPSSTTVALQLLESAGVPRDKIEVLGVEPASSTRDEANALLHYLEQRPVARILVVTSAFHSRRASWLLRRALAAKACTVQVALVSHSLFGISDWWKHEIGVSTLILEYAKWIHNLAWIARNGTRRIR